MKAPSPLLGFNNNVRHKGKVFHIQTEDSGIGHPHIITHLFADGGRILKSKKTSYSEHLEKPDMADIVRKMMQTQHKEMFLLLQSGVFDETMGLAGGNGGAAAAQPAASPPEPKPEPKAAPPPPPPVPPAVAAKAPTAVAAAAAAKADAPDEPTETPSGPPLGTKKTPSVEVDVRPVIDLSPGRYASTRAPDIFRTPDKGAPSLFGEEHISERSLDEVIMSYLAEDLGEE